VLGEVAKQDSEYGVRLAAVRKLTDQAVLADIAKKDRDADVRGAAVEKLTDQALLGDIAKKDSDVNVRRIAAGKVTDQGLLAEIARIDRAEDVRFAAAEKLTDQALAQAVLAEVAKTASNSWLRKAAVEKLTDQALLAEVAKKDSDSLDYLAADVRQAAIEKLTDPALLAEVARTNYWRVRKAAVEKLTDQVLLAEVAKNDGDLGLRLRAVKKLTDQALLAQIAETDTDIDVRTAAAARITDPTLRDQITQRAAALAKTITGLIEALPDLEAAWALVRIGEPAIWPLIRGRPHPQFGYLVDNKSTEHRCFGPILLAEIGMAAVKPLIAELNALEGDVRQALEVSNGFEVIASVLLTSRHGRNLLALVNIGKDAVPEMQSAVDARALNVHLARLCLHLIEKRESSGLVWYEPVGSVEARALIDDLVSLCLDLTEERKRSGMLAAWTASRYGPVSAGEERGREVLAGLNKYRGMLQQKRLEHLASSPQS
jgi:hypothetical protein